MARGVIGESTGQLSNKPGGRRQDVCAGSGENSEVSALLPLRPYNLPPLDGLKSLVSSLSLAVWVTRAPGQRGAAVTDGNFRTMLDRQITLSDDVCLS